MNAGEDGEIWQLLDSRALGGIESHVVQLAKGLQGAGQAGRIVLYRDYAPHPLRERAAAAGVAVDGLAGTPAALLAALRRRRPRLLHTHGYKAGLLGRPLGRLLGIPVVSTFHAGEALRGRLRLYDALDRWSAPLGHPLAVSEAIAGRVRGGAALLDNFVELPAEPTPVAAGGEIVFVGRLSREKGPDRFLRLARCFPELTFHCYGDGPLRGELARQAPANLTLHGAVNDVSAVWRRAALLCMPSRQEGLPMAALEAMAAGVPVLAFAVGGLPRLIEDGRGGLLVPAGECEGLAGRLEAWLAMSPGARAGLATAARERVRSRFSPAAVIPRLLDHYAAAGMEARR